MNQAWVRNYVEKYFTFHQCQVIEKAPSHTTFKLSVELDKDLTNRPYYWTFVERTGAEPETLTMTFIFDKEKLEAGIRGEELSFGTPRLKQIFNSSISRGRMVRLFQQYPNNPYKKLGSQALNPWLGVNFKVEFLSDKKKDKIISLGINLTNGIMKDNFIEKLKRVNLSPSIPMSIVINHPLLTFREAALQLEEWTLLEINKENFTWVIEAEERLENELELVENYFLSINTNENNEVRVEKQKRIDELSWQYSPRIEVNPINFGIFYLDDTFLKMSNI